MRIRRLFQMRVPELLCRGRQAASKRLERFGLVGHHEHEGQEQASSSTSMERRFFEGAWHRETPRLLDGWVPEARKALLASADAALDGRLDFLGYQDLRFGDPVDWRLDATTGRRAPFAHWSRLDPLDPDAVGDSKVVWELNRHQWLVRLAQAWTLTGDERYARAVARHLIHWTVENPRGMGINWASSLEVALRLISWCWVEALLEGSEALGSDLRRVIHGGIGIHAAHAERYLSTYFSPNTHLTGEALGLVYAGVLCPEMSQASRWRELGARILLEELARQVLADGVYFEQATCYQRYTVDIYLHFLLLGERNGLAIPGIVRERIERMLDFLLAIRHPDGSMPQIGDADGGRLLPLAPRAPDDFRDLFSTGAAIFRRPDYAWAAGGLAPETLWLLGPDAAEAFSTLVPAPPSEPPSRHFGDGGYAVMRSSWRADAHQLVLDVGPLGCSGSAAHGHSDLLGIQCAVFGRPYVVDPGTYGYAKRAWRDYFRGTAAHSTVMVDGEGQALPAAPFKWAERPAARLHRWRSDGGSDFADASHDAYDRLKDPVTHRRRVLFVKPRYWIVVDDLHGAVEHSVAVRFQLGPLPVTVDSAQWVRVGRGRGLLIRSFSVAPLKCELREGELAPIQGWISPDYGLRRPAPLLEYSAVTRLPVRLISLLMPVEDVAARAPEVAPLTAEGGALVGLVFGGGEEAVRFDERGFSVERR